MLGVGGPTKDLRCLGACQNISELVVEYPPLRMGVKYQCARHGCQCSTRNHQLWSKSFQRLPTDCGAWAPKDELGQPWKLRLAADLQYKSRKLCHKCAKIWKEQQTDAPASTRPATREAPKPPPPTKGPGRQKDEGFILGSSSKGSSDKSRLVEQGTLAQKRYEEALSRDGLTLVPQSGDGNCQVRCVANQVYGDPNLHPLIRKSLLAFILARPDVFDAFCPGTGGVSAYVRKMSRQDEWCDGLMLAAGRIFYRRPIQIYVVNEATGAKQMPTGLEEEIEGVQGSVPMTLSYEGDQHYNSISSSETEFGRLLTPPGQFEDARLAELKSEHLVMNGGFAEGKCDAVIKKAIKESLAAEASVDHSGDESDAETQKAIEASLAEKEASFDHSGDESEKMLAMIHRSRRLCPVAPPFGRMSTIGSAAA